MIYFIFIFVSRLNLKFRHHGFCAHKPHGLTSVYWAVKDPHVEVFYSCSAKKREFHLRIWQRTNEWSEENVANDSADKKEIELPARGSIKLHLCARISLHVILLISACAVFLVEVHFWKCCVKRRRFVWRQDKVPQICSIYFTRSRWYFTGAEVNCFLRL